MTTVCSAEPASSVPTRIVCFGDSITDGDTYPKVIMQALHDAKDPVPPFICAGVGGNTMKDMDARFDKSVAIFKPDMVTVLEGTNDACAGTLAEDYEKSLRSIVTKIKAIGARVMLVTPCENLMRPGNTKAEQDAYFAKVHLLLDSYEAAVRKVAADESCLLAENRKFFTEGLKDGRTLFVEDNAHPNFLGQSLIARSILDALGRNDVALSKIFDPQAVPGLVEKWMLRSSPLDASNQPIRLDADSISKLTPDATWKSCDLPERSPIASSAEIWLEQMRRYGAVMNTETIIGKGQMGQGVATVVSANGGPAFIQTGMGISTVWLNGAEVYNQMNVWTGAHPGKDRIPVTLRQGANTLVIEFKQSFFLAVTPNLVWESNLYR